MSPHFSLLNFITLVYHCLKKILHVKLFFLTFIIFSLSFFNIASADDYDVSDMSSVRSHCEVSYAGGMGVGESVEDCVKRVYKASPLKPANILDAYGSKMKLLATQAGVKLRNFTKAFFLFIAGVGIVWSCYSLLFKEPSLNAFIYEMTRLMLMIGFFWFLIDKMPVQLMKLGAGFISMAEKVKPDDFSGLSVVSTASSDILANSYNIAGKIFKTIKWTDSLNGMIFVKLICAVCIVIIGFMIALNWVLAYLHFYFISCWGIFLLGFAPVPWTRDTALNYLKTLIAHSFSLFAKALCIMITSYVIAQFANDLGTESTSGVYDSDYIYNCLNLALSIYMGYVICEKIPEALGGLIAPISPARGNIMGAMITGLALAGGVAGGVSRIGGSLIGRGASGVMGALRSK